MKVYAGLFLGSSADTKLRKVVTCVFLMPIARMGVGFTVAPTFTRTFIATTITNKRPRTHVTPSRRCITATTQKDPSTQPKELTPPPVSSNGVGSNGVSANGTAPSKPHTVLHERRDLQKDILWTLGWISIAGLTAGGIFTTSPVHSLEFITAYIVEYSLSVDNLFVFLLIFEYFRVPRTSQTRVLTYGIVGAMTMRGIMIVAGEALTHRFKSVSIAFAGLLLFSAVKLLTSEEEDDDDLEHNAVVKFSKSLMHFSDRYDGDRFFSIIDGAKVATPMLLVLLCIEFSDVVFALDSVPAVLGISDDTLVIYLSNILAIAGLRNLYFVLSDAIGDLRFLKQSLAVVLGFVGAKMLGGVAGFEVGVVQSLSFIVSTLAVGVGLSLAYPVKEDAVAGEIPPSEG